MHRYTLAECKYARTKTMGDCFYFMMPSDRTLFRCDQKVGEVLDAHALADAFGDKRMLRELLDQSAADADDSSKGPEASV